MIVYSTRSDSNNAEPLAPLPCSVGPDSQIIVAVKTGPQVHSTGFTPYDRHRPIQELLPEQIFSAVVNLSWSVPIRFAWIRFDSVPAAFVGKNISGVLVMILRPTNGRSNLSLFDGSYVKRCSFICI
jgi:hypothetical protein